MKKLIFIILFTISSFVLAVQPQPGINFKPTKEVIPTESKDKIEVVELFWYGCVHCFNMDPYLDKWADNLPKDVTFKRIPAIPRKDWVASAKAYYALESLGLLNKLHEKLFDAIHKEKIFKAAGATGVPTMIIDGKYFTSSTMSGGEQNAIDIMNFIIKNVRKDKAKAKK